MTVDENSSPFDSYLISKMIEQSGLSLREFYGSTRKTAKKIGIECLLAPSKPE